MRRTAARLGRAVQRRGVRVWRQVTGRIHRSVLHLSERDFLALFELPGQSQPLTWERLNRHLEERAREAPAWRPDAEAVQGHEEVLEAADQLSRRVFTLAAREPVAFPEGMDWRFDPTGDPRRRWARELNRHPWVTTLIRACELTGRIDYATACIELLRDWIRANPPPRMRDETHPSWNLMNVGLRCMVWPDAYFSLIRVGALEDADRKLLLRSMCDQGRFLRLFKTHGNHLLRESNGLANLAAWFPEVRESSEWRVTALRRLAAEARQQINEDGTHVEMSPAYQWLVAEEFETSLNIMEREGWHLPGIDLTDTLQRLYRAIALMRLPDGKWPQLNDGFFELWEHYDARLHHAAERFALPELLQRHSHSNVLPNAGLAFMRHANDCMLLKGGPYGGLHGHEDKLSIEVHVAGEPLIVDPGTYTYNAADPFRSHLVSSLSHNTVTVDGLSQVRRWLPQHRRLDKSSARQTRWTTTEKFDLVAGRYEDGYGPFELYRTSHWRRLILRDVSHERSVLYVRPDYWLIIDDLQSPGGHEYVRGFQAAAGSSIELDGQRSARVKADRAYLNIVWGEPDVDADVVSGEPAPRGGWISNGSVGHMTPAPRLLLASRGAGRTRMVTLLVPAAPGRPALFSDLAVVASPDPSQIEVEIHGAGIHDALLMQNFSYTASQVFRVSIRRSSHGERMRTHIDYRGDRR